MSIAVPPSTSPVVRELTRRPTFAACIEAIRAPELYRNFAIHLFVMLPAATLMCWFATRADLGLRLDPIAPLVVRLPIGLGLIGIGGFWVWYVYGYLYLSGGGSPGTHVDGGPTALVDTGPYAMIRHPSVIGKLCGVIGLGVCFGSPVFLVGFVPVLVAYSVVTNRYLQEPFCDARFGMRYQIYRERVPMLIPRPSGVARWRRGEGAVPEDGPREEGLGPPAGIWMEFRGYLVGLASLILLSGLVAWLLN